MTTTDSTDVLLTKTEVLSALKISLPSFNRLLAAGKIRKVKQGKKVFVRQSDLNEYIASLTDDPTPIRKSS